MQQAFISRSSKQQLAAQRLVAQKFDGAFQKKTKKKNYYQREVAKMDNEEKEAFKEAEFTLREAKRARKPKKMTIVDEDDNRFSKKRGTRGGVNSQNKKKKFNKK